MKRIQNVSAQKSSFLRGNILYSFHDNFHFSDCECTGLDPRWQNVTTDTKFPVKQGEVVVVNCKRKHINLGVRSFTCVKDTSFIETDARPLCNKTSKYMIN